MKIKFLFGLMFVLSTFVLQAQYVGSVQAIQILETEATALENGTSTIKDLVSSPSITGTSNTLNVLSISSTNDVSVTSLSESIFPAIMFRTAKEIQMTGNTATGVQNAENFFASTTSESNRKDIIDATFVYIKDLISI